ncbi:MAG: type II toxin-antitoxin system RelE/ParE family toxin [Holophaga sp.]|nr:type II toxin-antitoxin system RelE/ParE family toxin [Holophaga sp.]
MALKVLWTDRAKVHLRDILDYIAFDNPDAARALAQKIFQAADGLAEFPLAGRTVPELEDSPFRERVVPPCRIIYQLRDQTVIVLVVIRTERRLLLANL